MISTDEREAVVAYFDDIAPIPTLSKEHEQLLAKEVESATAEFRDKLCSIPWMAQETVRIWNDLRESGRTTGKLSESFGSGAPGPDDVREQVDRALTRLERLVKRRERITNTSPRDEVAIERIDKRSTKLLIEADLSLALLSRTRARLVALREDLQALVDERRELQSPRRAPRSETGKAKRRAELRDVAKRRQELEKELGLPAKQFLAQMDQLDLAWERLDRSKNEFVRRNLKLVIKLAKEFRNMGVAFPDLIQEGNLGLIRAVEKFDHTRGFKFSTYAVWWIRQALIRAIQNHSRTIRVPSHLHELLRKYYRAYEKLEKELGRDPTRKEIAKTLKLPLDRAEQLQSMVREPISLEKDVPGTDSRKVKDTVEDPNPISASDGMDLDRLGAATRESIESLGDRERKILHWRFGLEGEDEHTLEQIGKKLGLSRERVRQLESRALEKLRSPQNRNKLLPFFDEVG